MGKIKMEYFSIIVERKTASKKKNETLYIYDQTKDYIIENIVEPYVNNKSFIVDGYRLDSSCIERLKIVKTDDSIRNLLLQEQKNVSAGILMIWTKPDILSLDKYATDVTLEFLNKVEINQSNLATVSDAKYIFIVHGHQYGKVVEIENFVRSIGYDPIVLFKEPSAGQTIIEKIESLSKKACFGIVLYTKCDFGYALNHEQECKPRARQNVVFEHGYLMAKLTRTHVCALVDGNDIELPSDISGIVYQSIDDGGNWKYELAKNMNAVGLKIDMTKIR